MGVDALLLVHPEGDAHQGLVVVVVQVGEAFLPQEELVHVAGEVEGGVVLDGGDGHLLDLIHREVQIDPVLAVIDMAVVVDLIDLVVLATRVVHDHDVVLLEVLADVLVIEGLRGVFLRGDHVALGIGPGPGELLRRETQAQDEDPVNLLELLHLHRLELRIQVGGCFLPLLALELVQPGGLRGLAQAQTVLAELESELGAHLGSAVGVHALREHLGRNHAVFHDEVGDAGKLSAVTDGVREEPVHFPVVVREILRVDDALQEQVRLLQLVVEEDIVLREDHRAHVELVDHLGTQHVQSREQPAAAGGELVRAALGLHHVGEAGVHRDVVRIQGQRVDGGGIQGIAERLVGGRAFVALGNFAEDAFGESAGMLGVQGDGTGQSGDEGKDLFHKLIGYQSFSVGRGGGR